MAHPHPFPHQASYTHPLSRYYTPLHRFIAFPLTPTHSRIFFSRSSFSLDPSLHHLPSLLLRTFLQSSFIIQSPISSLLFHSSSFTSSSSCLPAPVNTVPLSLLLPYPLPPHLPPLTCFLCLISSHFPALVFFYHFSSFTSYSPCLPASVTHFPFSYSYLIPYFPSPACFLFLLLPFYLLLSLYACFISHSSSYFPNTLLVFRFMLSLPPFPPHILPILPPTCFLFLLLSSHRSMLVSSPIPLPSLPILYLLSGLFYPFPLSRLISYPFLPPPTCSLFLLLSSHRPMLVSSPIPLPSLPILSLFSGSCNPFPLSIFISYPFLLSLTAFFSFSFYLPIATCSFTFSFLFLLLLLFVSLICFLTHLFHPSLLLLALFCLLLVSSHRPMLISSPIPLYSLYLLLLPLVCRFLLSLFSFRTYFLSLSFHFTVYTSLISRL